MPLHNILPLPIVPNVGVRHVPGFPGYAVSDDGQVFSCRHFQPPTWRRIKPLYYPRSKAYLYVWLHIKDKRKRFAIHQLVLLAFIGACPNGLQCCHNNGNPHDNKLSNLRYDTAKSNMKDRAIHGYVGEKVATSKLTEAQVKEIRKLFSLGYTRSAIAAQFNITPTNVSNVVKRRWWKHVL